LHDFSNGQEKHFNVVGYVFDEGMTKILMTTGKSLEWAKLSDGKVSAVLYCCGIGSALVINTDYFSKKRDASNPFPGPFELGKQQTGTVLLKVWPVERN
jgi:hypothetical protein